MNTASVTKAPQKGLNIDDTTFHWCSHRIPNTWPNTQEPVRSIRTFKSWEVDWADDNRGAATQNLIDYIMNNSVKVLFGVGVTCNKTDDKLDWERTKAIMRKVGPEHIMGLAIGNEQDLLYTKEYIKPFPECISNMWEGSYMWQATVDRITDLDAMGPDFADIPVTSVISGAALYSLHPFREDSNAMMTTYLREAYKKYGKRWVWSANIYTFWNPFYRRDFPWFFGKCKGAIKKGTTWGPGGDIYAQFKDFRQRIWRITGNWDDPLWIGEIGWSSPSPEAFPSMAARYCKDFASKETYRKFYENYLRYDMTLDNGFVGPDHVFYFTIRDASQFGTAEHFGLMA